jgi:ATP-dependent DNA helicase RecQ
MAAPTKTFEKIATNRMTDRAQTILKNVFGFNTFRPLQREVIASILAGNDTLAIMPTGGGKSLCYQIPAQLFSGLTVVVSPLIALMKDQVDQMQRFGVGAVMLNSALAPDAYRQNVAQVASGPARLLYVAPETLMMPRTQALLAKTGIDCLAIDEAHCISEWGHDFRPEYRQLVQIRNLFPNAVCAAFTATATPRVRKDIQTTLGFKRADTFVGSFNRENLFLKVVPKQNPATQIKRLIQKLPEQSGIIYCATRKQVDELTGTLRRQGISALAYHAGLSDHARKAHQERFIRDDARIIVATIAFGMGIDKPDVRFVAHFDLPKNIESYYQEIGRAGRDGLPADCLLLFSYADVYKIKHFIQQKPTAERRAANIHLNALLRYAEWQGCRRIPLLQYFGETAAEQCGHCDNCTSGTKASVDLTVPAQKFLSCVYRTGERFGAAHIINVLRGSKAQRIMQLNHQQLSTYGIGRDLTQKQWQTLARQFLHQGLLVENMDYGGFRLGPGARAVLKGDTTVRGWLDEDQTDTVDGAAARPPKPELPDYNHSLLQQLRAKRKQIADSEGVPPYVVFADKTLIEMAAYFPQSEAALHRIHGVGDTKLVTYGPAFLPVIQTYCRKHQIEEKVPASARPPKKNRNAQKRRHQVVGEAFNAGRSVHELMTMFTVKQKTILDHLYRYWCEGHRLERHSAAISIDLPEEQAAAALAYFKQFGIQRLKPVFDAMAGQIDYEGLAALRLIFITQNGLMAMEDQ